jgi:NAD(P)-dependent dehydrogenase (short-subunit alcohol dehydrogenase family)
MSTKPNLVQSDQLEAKVALVTGGSNGIGAAVVRRLAAGGARVVIADVDEAAGHALAEDVHGTFVRCDVRSLDDNRAAVAAAVEAYGGLDLAHLNAGVATGCGIENLDVELYRRAMGINLDGVVYGVHAVVPALHARGGGTIVITASMAGLLPVPFDPLYAANKHAVVGLARSLGPFYANNAIKVQALCPSFADTAILGGAKPILEQAGFRVLEVDDVVDAFFQLLDSEGTGECWFVVPGRPSEPFRFRNAPGPRAPA